MSSPGHSSSALSSAQLTDEQRIAIWQDIEYSYQALRQAADNLVRGYVRLGDREGFSAGMDITKAIWLAELMEAERHEDR